MRRIALGLAPAALTLLLVAGCAVPDVGSTASSEAAALRTAVPAPVVSSPAASTVPGLVFPVVSSPTSRGDMMVYANKLLYERSGKLCIEQTFLDPGGVPNWEGMLARMKDRSGILEDGVSFVGDLPGALQAFGVERSGIELEAIAFGLGRVPASRALPHLPQGTWWMPKFEAYIVGDGRTVWHMNGEYFAAKDC